MDERADVATDRSTVGDVDPVTRDDIRALADGPGAPKISIHLPTHRKGAEVRQDPVQLRKLLDRAAEQLTDAGHREHVGPLLDPARALLDDTSFWQHQSDGLAVFASADLHRHLRVPIPLTPTVQVGDTFHVAPLAPLLSGDGEFLLLALSQNDVRLFAGTRWTIRRIDTGPMPTSMAEALQHEDPERQLQARSIGGGEAVFHGHGASEHDKATVERYLRAVEHGLHELLGADRRPLVLACVGYYVPIFRAVSRHADLVEPAIDGNPDHAKPVELHSAAWERVRARFDTAGRAWERYRDSLGTGNVSRTLNDAAARAAEGRVDTLFVRDHEPNGDADDDTNTTVQIDRAILATLAASGDVVSVPAEQLPGGEAAAALLRY
ncbi:MAG: hypothetical protein WD225_13710 [Ilumatobacteraceae bacterium]